MSDSFIRSSFAILSADVIIQTILFKMDFVDIVQLCSSSREFRTFCDRNSKRIWTMLLRRDYPQFGVIGDPKKHYMKIFNNEGQIYKYSVGADPILISDPIKDFLLTLSIYYDAVVANGKYYLGLERTGNNVHLIVYNPSLQSWYKNDVSASFNTMGVLKYTNNYVLYDYTQYIVGYSGTAPGTTDYPSSADIVPNIRTKSFRMPDGITKARVRFLKFNYKKKDGKNTLIKMFDADFYTFEDLSQKPYNLCLINYQLCLYYLKER